MISEQNDEDCLRQAQEKLQQKLNSNNSLAHNKISIKQQ
jgi:hypothetical protein